MAMMPRQPLKLGEQMQAGSMAASDNHYGHQPVSGLRPISHPHNNTMATKVILLFYEERERNTHTHTQCVVRQLSQPQRYHFSTPYDLCCSLPDNDEAPLMRSHRLGRLPLRTLHAVPSQETAEVLGKPGAEAASLPPSAFSRRQGGWPEAGWPPGKAPSCPLSVWLSVWLASWLLDARPKQGAGVLVAAALSHTLIFRPKCGKH